MESAICNKKQIYVVVKRRRFGFKTNYTKVFLRKSNAEI